MAIALLHCQTQNSNDLEALMCVALFHSRTQSHTVQYIPKSKSMRLMYPSEKKKRTNSENKIETHENNKNYSKIK